MRRNYKPHEKLVRKAARACMMENSIVDMHLISDEEMRELNKVHTKKDTPTNVLSFPEPQDIPHPELKKGETYLGEVYLAPDYIEKKEENIAHLTIHGILHCMGYTHDTEHDRMGMEKREREILEELT